MSIVHIGIGSNLGNREEHCLKAVRLCAEKGILVRQRSSMYETEPWGVKDQPGFINMAIEGETGLTPAQLLNVLRMIEDEVGRVETFRWGPRVIDLDILLYDDLVMNTPELRIPHPLMHKREFVLRPLVEIAPDTIHPVLRKTIKELLSDLTTTQ
ncbi:MAG TPA: 2-amino-4-hydroxy-6-hydroxymethyldihydropteridine diphosphokinase [Thermodesulfovibrionales bacterium]|nr:2-amino-4-hydroxy-6-hydroxymethyldihydropteridine diphosphokinase [Thermodesulfovibrionales bacterium]